MTVFEMMSLMVSLMALLSTVIIVSLQILVYKQEWKPVLLCENIKIKKPNDKEPYVINIRLQNVSKTAVKYDLVDYTLLLDGFKQEDLESRHSKKLIGSDRYMIYKAKHKLAQGDNSKIKIEFKIKYSKVHSKREFTTVVKAEFIKFPQDTQLVMLESFFL